ncbi:serine-rich adhesin for platelets [Drosophila bipectinata]|uniref:serine-rich adhesin for platelets n=1 Tax=Drosophila bipectinata TaxID=42026 RepID=UPI001C8B0074|nr:serine-rich adhesin for platelets [Drosophila bipectinata]
MSKRVSIVLPDEMPSRSASKKDQSRQARNSMKSNSHEEPIVFLAVSQESSPSSLLSSQKTSSNLSLHETSAHLLSLESFVSPDPSPKSTNLASPRPLSTDQAHSMDSSVSSIKQFLRNTVALVRAGESFTSVKRLFYNFVKRNEDSTSNTVSKESPTDEGRMVGSQVARMPIPNHKHSTNTFFSDVPTGFTVPSTSQMTSSPPHSVFSFNHTKYDFASLISDVTPLTGYTPNTAQAWSTEDADYRSETSLKTSTAPRVGLSSSVALSLGTHRSLSSSNADGLFRATSGGHSRPSLAVNSTERPKSSVSKQRGSRNIKKLLSKSPKSSPQAAPRTRIQSITSTVNPAAPSFTIVSASRQLEEREAQKFISGSILSSERQNLKVAPNVTPRMSVSQVIKESQSSSSRLEGTRRSSLINNHSSRSDSNSNNGQRQKKSVRISEDPVRAAEFAFTLVSPEEAEPSQPTEGSSNPKSIEDGSSCETYKEGCNCHHCQDMRRAVKRAEYFNSPQGQKQLEAKLLAKNFFMDICAMSIVRAQIQDDLYGTRKCPPARVSYPVCICGANRLDAGSLSLNWFTHDLNSVDHFDFYVDDVPSRSVYNLQAKCTVLVDVDAKKIHKLRMRAVPVRGSGAQATPVDKLMSEVIAGHMRNVTQGKLFARCLKHLDTQVPQPSLVDFWTDSEFLYMPA